MFESRVGSNEICLGYQGEHLARKLIFDMSETIEKFSADGSFNILNLRSGENTPYYIDPAYYSFDPDTKELSWIISGVETDVFGTAGKCEIHYIVNDTVIKPAVFNTIVHEGLGEAGARPNSTQSWVTKVNDSALSIEAAIKQLEILIQRAEEVSQDAISITTKPPYIGENGTWWVWDAETNSYVDSGVESFTADAVRYKKIQELSESEKQQARANIGAGTSDFSGRFSDLIDVPEDTNFGDLITDIEATITRSKNNEREVVAFRKIIDDFDFDVSDPYPNVNGLREVSLAIDFAGKSHVGTIIIDEEITLDDNIRIRQLATDEKIPRFLANDLSNLNFIRIKGMNINMITAKTNGEVEHLTSSSGVKMYWANDITNCSFNTAGYPVINGRQVSITAHDTGFPVQVYKYEETIMYTTYLDSNHNFNPHIILGSCLDPQEEGVHILKTKDGLEVYNLDGGTKKGMFVGEKYVDFAGIRRPTIINVNRAGLSVALEGGYGYSYEFKYNDAGEIVALVDHTGHVIQLNVGLEE